jgi:regulator of protease activity HflC (stomatin/prohibitin superfamily)
MMDTMEKQMEAERNKRAEITLALGKKESRINLSQGERQEAINLSEGEKVKRINESDGKAREISILAEASAKGISRIAAAIRKPGGVQAIQMRILEQYIEEFGKILNSANVTVVPQQLANIKGFFEGLGKVSTAMGDQDQPEPALPPPIVQRKLKQERQS